MSLELRRRLMMQQLDKTPVPSTNQIIYQTRDGKIIDFSGICNGTMISNEIVGEYIIATFDREVTTINNYTGNLNIKYVDFPYTCKTFSRTAFDNCHNIMRAILRAEACSLGDYCFSVFNGVAKITLYATKPPVRRANAVGSNPMSQKPIIEVPKGCADAYKNSSYWAGYDIIEMS